MNRKLIDWVSFTVDVQPLTEREPYMMRSNLAGQLDFELCGIWQRILDVVHIWDIAGGRAPYNAALRSEHGISVYYHPKLTHALVEVSGRGCDFLRKHEILDALLIEVKNRVTRIDLAVDIETETTPKEFEMDSQAARFKSRGYVTSDTGETVYIGSKKSERYCRVYRYSEPHPRSRFLRTEFVFKKRNAKTLIETLIAERGDLTNIALAAGATYGFEHECWDLRGEEIPLKGYTPERRSGKTLMWMVSQVAPAFKKLVSEGVIEDPEEFIRTHFL